MAYLVAWPERRQELLKSDLRRSFPANGTVPIQQDCVVCQDLGVPLHLAIDLQASARQLVLDQGAPQGRPPTTASQPDPASVTS